jgi:hypothetical protein
MICDHDNRAVGGNSADIVRRAVACKFQRIQEPGEKRLVPVLLSRSGAQVFEIVEKKGFFKDRHHPLPGPPIPNRSSVKALRLDCHKDLHSQCGEAPLIPYADIDTLL